MRVMVVDDDDDAAMSLCVVLQALDCETAIAHEGAEYLRTCRDFAPQLSFIDLEMPGMTGLEVVAALRKDTSRPHGRLVCLTGHGDIDDERVCLDGGFDELVTKPMGFASISMAVAELRGRSMKADSPLANSKGRTLMYKFLSNNQEDLVARCRAKVAERPTREATPAQLANGIPLFLRQLIRTLQAEEEGRTAESLRISGPPQGDTTELSEVGVGAIAHGRQLLELGYSIGQVVHDYGDICQAITDLAVERDAPFSVDEFRTLNRCLDNAIADAVEEFSARHEASVALKRSAEENERLGMLVHELRNYVQTAAMGFGALQSGNLAVGGSTGDLVKRSLTSMSTLLTRSISAVRVTAGASGDTPFSLASFIAEAADIASLDAAARGLTVTVPPVDPHLAIGGDREHLLAALNNLLQNALKFTRPHTDVTLHGHATAGRISIDVSDHCGGLGDGNAERMFTPFGQRSTDKTGLGLGLSIARQSVEADGGLLSVRDVPGKGCVFTISLPVG
jgi:signal transduction histidine kinase/ActR/RegA family two-component response regulator